MKLLAESLAVTVKSSKMLMQYSKLATYLEKIRKVVEPTRATRTGRKLRAAILHGPCNLKLGHIPEEMIQETQVLKKEMFFHVICLLAVVK